MERVYEVLIYFFDQLDIAAKVAVILLIVALVARVAAQIVTGH